MSPGVVDVESEQAISVYTYTVYFFFYFLGMFMNDQR